MEAPPGVPVTDIVPVFVLSVQRSGSTLLQRMLGAHPDIATVSEPWILLPLLYSMRSEGVYSEYGHAMAVRAIEDFTAELPGGADEYRAELRSLALRLYRSAAGEGPGYFVDKTPRYALAIDELVATFPEARFVVLWRNPLGVIASIIETWGDDYWNLDEAKVDIYDGLERLVAGYQKHQDLFHSLRYEDLVTDPDETIRGLFDYLGLDQWEGAVRQFGGTRLEGRMGDPRRDGGYETVSRDPLTKWRATLNNPFRKAWAQRYLEIIGSERLAVMGYDLATLQGELEDVRTTSHLLAGDLTKAWRGFIHTMFETGIMRRKLRRLPAWHEIHRHN